MTHQPRPPEPYRPPFPRPPGSPTIGLVRGMFARERDLLRMLPSEAYELLVAPLGYSRRKIFLVNDPAVLRRLLLEEPEAFPKSDLMVGSLEPLVHDGMFISGGAIWARQRRMVEPAFSHMRVNRGFAQMQAALDTFEAWADGHAARGEAFSLEPAMSHLTADIICRTIFSRALDSDAARNIFAAFARFQQGVANIEIARLILGSAWAKVEQPAPVLAAAEDIRSQLAAFLTPRLEPGAPALADIAGDVIAARDPDTGAGFEMRELIDQIGVFFLAGHETTASALTWTLFILSQRPEHAARIRREVEEATGGGEIGFESVKRLNFTRAVFRETLRLYPPLGFLPRVALADCEIAGRKIPRGALLMVAPWIVHRHRALWRDPDVFDPERFLGAREAEIPTGAYLPFGMGPRICVGAAFAMVEGALILARLMRRYDVTCAEPESVRPVSQLTTRPERPILLTARRLH